MVQVLENTDGGATGSLMACLDMCTTVMGKRQLRAWLCRPMARIADITARQDAVAELMGPAAEPAQAARSALTGTLLWPHVEPTRFTPCLIWPAPALCRTAPHSQAAKCPLSQCSVYRNRGM